MLWATAIVAVTVPLAAESLTNQTEEPRPTTRPDIYSATSNIAHYQSDVPGEPAKIVTGRLGHSTAAYTQDAYQEVLPGMQRDAARRFGQRLQWPPTRSDDEITDATVLVFRVRAGPGARVDATDDPLHPWRRPQGGRTVSRHTHDDGEPTRRTVDYEYVHHHEGGEPGLLVVRGVRAEVCVTCDGYWFDEDTGFALSRALEEHAPAAGRVVTVDWVEVRAA